jgi:alpha-amylase
MFASQVPDYLDDDLLGTEATHAETNFNPDHALYRRIQRLSRLNQRHDALRDGAHQHRHASDEAGIYAFSRIDRRDQREYVVVLNNSEKRQTADVPTWIGTRSFHKLYGPGAPRVRTRRDRTLPVSQAPLSATVYRSSGRIPGSKRDLPGPDRTRALAVDRHRRHRPLPGLPRRQRGASGHPDYRATVLDNRRHTRTSSVRRAQVPAPELTIEVPDEGSNVRGIVEVRAVADPERSTDTVTFERRVGDGGWTEIGTDDSSPAYTAFDDLSTMALAAGTAIAYRATLQDGDTTVVSDVRTVRFAGPPAEQATVHYFRPAGDYADWGLHLWGDAVHPDVLATVTWDSPLQRTGVVDGWAVYEIPLQTDEEPVNFIMHRPGGDSVPDTREPGGDRSFLPINSPEIWLIQGDPTVYTSQPTVP